MSENTPAPLYNWLAMSMESAARSTIDRVRRSDDVVHVAVMPDVHLANDVCVGTVMATRRLIYPGAVGGDIGCGMLAIPFESDANVLRDPSRAGTLLRLLGERIPIHRHHRSCAIPLHHADLSHGSLISVFKNVGILQLGTLGGGNHFIEFQFDNENRLWLMIHSGSRAMGQAVKNYHVAKATLRSGSMMALDADMPAGQAYLHDQHWARDFAKANRQAMADAVIELMKIEFKIHAIESMKIFCDHNHVQREEHFNQSLLVHRKGAMPASAGMPGVVPGSMGTFSYHVTGKGNENSLRSSAHGAGRLLSRHAARDRYNRADLQRQMQNVWFDHRLTNSLREESPKCYKDVRSVMQAQSDLVAVDRTLRPLLVFKGTG